MKSITQAADAAKEILDQMPLERGQHLVVIAFDDAGSVQIRGTDSNMDLSRTVGALHRAAYTMHQLRSVVRFDQEGEPGEVGT